MAILIIVVLKLFALLCVGVALYTARVLAEVLVYLVLFGPRLQRDLGFRDDTAILPSSGIRGYVSAVSVSSVIEGGC